MSEEIVYRYDESQGRFAVRFFEKFLQRELTDNERTLVTGVFSTSPFNELYFSKSE